MPMAVSSSLRLTKEKLRSQRTLILNLAWGNNNDANYVDLYTRALELSAELRAKMIFRSLPEQIMSVQIYRMLLLKQAQEPYRHWQ